MQEGLLILALTRPQGVLLQGILVELDKALNPLPKAKIPITFTNKLSDTELASITDIVNNEEGGVNNE